MGTSGLVVVFSNVYVVCPYRIGLFPSNGIRVWIGYTPLAEAREVRLVFNIGIYGSLFMLGLPREDSRP